MLAVMSARSPGRRAVTFFAAVVVAIALGPASALAAPPANDTPAAATPLGALPATVSGVTAEATMDADEPAPLTANDDDGTRHGLDRSVWFSYAADRTRKLLADTCDANFTSHIDVYQGPPEARLPIPTQSNDYRDCAGDRRSFAVTAGVTYLIRVTAERDGVRTPDGGVFHLNVAPQDPPANDAFSRATALPGTGRYTPSLAFSTLELGEPTIGQDVGSVWLRFVPTQSLPYTAEVDASRFDFTLAVYEARGSTINRLRRLGDDYTESDVNATVAFNGLAGHAYYIRVASSAKLPGQATLNLTSNTAQGLGLLVTPSENTLIGVRTTGLKAVLSCARSCKLGVDLLVAPTDARRYGLVKAKNRSRRPVRIGHIGGTLQTGTPSSVTIPITSPKVRARLRTAKVVHYILRVSVRGRTASKPVTTIVVVT